MSRMVLVSTAGGSSRSRGRGEHLSFTRPACSMWNTRKSATSSSASTSQRPSATSRSPTFSRSSPRPRMEPRKSRWVSFWPPLQVHRRARTGQLSPSPCQSSASCQSGRKAHTVRSAPSYPPKKRWRGWPQALSRFSTLTRSCGDKKPVQAGMFRCRASSSLSSARARSSRSPLSRASLFSSSVLFTHTSSLVEKGRPDGRPFHLS